MTANAWHSKADHDVVPSQVRLRRDQWVWWGGDTPVRYDDFMSKLIIGTLNSTHGPNDGHEEFAKEFLGNYGMGDFDKLFKKYQNTENDLVNGHGHGFNESSNGLSDF